MHLRCYLFGAHQPLGSRLRLTGGASLAAVASKVSASFVASSSTLRIMQGAALISSKNILHVTKAATIRFL